MPDLIDYDGLCFALFPNEAKNDNVKRLKLDRDEYRDGSVDQAVADACALWCAAGLMAGSVIGMCWLLHYWPIQTLMATLAALGLMMGVELLLRRDPWKAV